MARTLAIDVLPHEMKNTVAQAMLRANAEAFPSLSTKQLMKATDDCLRSMDLANALAIYIEATTAKH